MKGIREEKSLGLEGTFRSCDAESALSEPVAESHRNQAIVLDIVLVSSPGRPEHHAGFLPLFTHAEIVTAGRRVREWPLESVVI